MCELKDLADVQTAKPPNGIAYQIFQLYGIECYVYVSGFLAEDLSPCLILTPGDQGEACMIPPSQKGESASCAYSCRTIGLGNFLKFVSM